MLILVAGDRGAGKTELIERMREGRYAETNSYHESPRSVSFYTNFGPMDVEFHEVAEHGGATHVQAHGAIIVIDVNAQASFQNAVQWHNKLVRVYGEIAMVLCGNKADGNERNLHVKEVHLQLNVALPYYEISNRTSEEETLYEPFLCLARTLVDPYIRLDGYRGDALPDLPVLTAAQIAAINAGVEDDEDL